MYSRVVKHVYIGNRGAIYDMEYKAQKIKTIIDVGKVTDDYETHINDQDIINSVASCNIIKAEISTSPNINKLKQLANEMETASRDNSVVVVCDDGVNKSALVISVYLKLIKGKSASAAINLVTRANLNRNSATLTIPEYRKIIEDI